MWYVNIETKQGPHPPYSTQCVTHSPTYWCVLCGNALSTFMIFSECTSDQFMCGNALSTFMIFSDCTSDQFMCGNALCTLLMFSECTSDQFKCGNALSTLLMFSDCTSDQFKCGNTLCIDNSLVCNRIDNCPDGSDEQFCSKYKMSTHIWLQWNPWIVIILNKSQPLIKSQIKKKLCNMGCHYWWVLYVTRINRLTKPTLRERIAEIENLYFHCQPHHKRHIVWTQPSQVTINCPPHQAIDRPMVPWLTLHQ